MTSSKFLCVKNHEHLDLWGQLECHRCDTMDTTNVAKSYFLEFTSSELFFKRKLFEVETSVRQK